MRPWRTILCAIQAEEAEVAYGGAGRRGIRGLAFATALRVRRAGATAEQDQQRAGEQDTDRCHGFKLHRRDVLERSNRTAVHAGYFFFGLPTLAQRAGSNPPTS